MICGWLKNSFIDFPGTVATVLFFGGCNLRCPFCHNPSIVRGGTGVDIDLEEVLLFLRQRQGRIGGAVLSGGEPTIHASIAEYAVQIRATGCRVKLDTNGMLPEKIRQIAPDYLALDIKTIPQRYARLCAAPFPDVERRLQESVDVVRSMKERAEIRITLAPGFIDEVVAQQLEPLLKGVAKIFLQPMQRNVSLLDPAFAELPPLSEEEAQRCCRIFSQYAGSCQIRSL